MASLNRVMLIGNAGKDCDLRYSASGTAQGSFSLAVNNRRKGASGEWEDQTEWFNVVMFADMAERIAQYITKGKPLYVEGRLQTRSWDNDAGVKQYRTEVIANQVQLLGGRDEAQGGPANNPDQQRRGNYPRGQSVRPGPDTDIDDLPFE
jgi:single-strand DNA-binding protein